MNKKTFSLLLSVAMTTAVLSGCGDQAASDPAESDAALGRVASHSVSSDAVSENAVKETSSKPVALSSMTNTSSKRVSSSVEKTSSVASNAKTSSKKKTSSKRTDNSKVSKTYVSSIVDLTQYFNKDAFSFDKKRSDGDFDEQTEAGVGVCTFPADGLKTEITYDGIDYKLGSLEDGKNNAVKCAGQTITLNKPTECDFIGVLASSASLPPNFLGEDNKFVINYTDGSSSTSTHLIYNWTNTVQDDAVILTDHRHWNSDIKRNEWIDDGYKGYISQYKLNVTSGKQVKSVTLPGFGRIHLFSMTVVTAK